MRFTIRDLLWLMVVVALLVGAWLDRRDLVTARQSAIDAQAKAEGETKEMQTIIRELYAALGRRGLTTKGEFGKKMEVVGPFKKGQGDYGPQQ